MDLVYIVDGKETGLTLDNAQDMMVGEDICLSLHYKDLTENCDWFSAGYKIINFFSDEEFKAVYSSLGKIICRFLESHSVKTEGFSLENYHKFVDNDLHLKTISHTRRLYPENFNIDINEIVKKIEAVCQTTLNFNNPIAKKDQWIIVRINRPGSIDFNPVHKDIYESYDGLGTIPRMINCWIPICGVSGNTGLPVAPGSHLISENFIKRTKAGSIVNGDKYSVNCIASWKADNSMITLVPETRQAIIFSSHLIHGLARNFHKDETRISFEFRLYER